MRFPVLACYANAFGTLAGGAQALAHDYVTGWALLTVAQQGYWETLGVTESLAVRYLRPVGVGEGVGLESEVGFFFCFVFLDFVCFDQGFCLLTGCRL